MSLGTQIKKARLGMRYTQYQLARHLDVDPMTVSRWERDVAAPSIKTLRMIAKLAEIPTADFFAEEDEREKVA